MDSKQTFIDRRFEGLVVIGERRQGEGRCTGRRRRDALSEKSGCRTNTGIRTCRQRSLCISRVTRQCLRAFNHSPLALSQNRRRRLRFPELGGDQTPALSSCRSRGSCSRSSCSYMYSRECSCPLQPSALPHHGPEVRALGGARLPERSRGPGPAETLLPETRRGPATARSASSHSDTGSEHRFMCPRRPRAFSTGVLRVSARVSKRGMAFFFLAYENPKGSQ